MKPRYYAYLFILLLLLVLNITLSRRNGSDTTERADQSIERIGYGDPVSADKVAATVDRWVEMWNSYDLDEVGELFLQDGALTYFSSEKEGLIRGYDAVLEHHKGFGFVPGGTEQGSRLWLGETAADVFGTTAVVTGIWYFSREGEPESDAQKGPVTIVIVRDNDEVRIAHMNFAAYQ